VEVAAVLAAAVASMVQLLWPVLPAAKRNDVALIELFSGNSEWLIGGGIDLAGTLWTFDHAVTRLTDDLPIHAPAPMFQPMGFDVAQAQGMAWLDAWMAAPIIKLFGLTGAYNLHLVLTLSLTFGASYALVRATGVSVPWALALAHSVLVNPLVAKEVLEGRPTQVHLVFHALFLLALLAVGRRWLKPVRGGLLAGLCLAASCLVYWFTGAAVGIAGAVVVGIWILSQRRRELVGAGLAVCVGAMVPIVLLTWPVLGSLASMEGGQTPVPLGPFTVSTLAGPWKLQGVGELWWAWREAGLAVPLLAVGLLASLPAAGRKRALPWLLAALTTLTMLWGPLLQIGDWLVPTASGIVQQIWPPMGRGHQAARFLVAPLLCLAVAAGLGIHALEERHVRLRWPLLAGAFALALWPVDRAVLEGARPLSQPLTAPIFYEKLGELDLGGIIDVPLDESHRDFVNQVIHGLPLLGGMGIRGPNTRPPGHADLVASNSVYGAMDDIRLGRVPRGMEDDDLAVLREAGLGVIVVHAPATKREAEFRAVLGPPVARHRKRIAWALPESTTEEP